MGDDSAIVVKIEGFSLTSASINGENDQNLGLMNEVTIKKEPDIDIDIDNQESYGDSKPKDASIDQYEEFFIKYERDFIKQDNQDMLIKIKWLETQIQPVLHLKRLTKSEIFKSKISKSKGKIKNLQKFSNEKCEERKSDEGFSLNQSENILIKHENSFFEQEMILSDQLENTFNFGPDVKSSEFEPISKISLISYKLNGQKFGNQDQEDTIQIKSHEKPTIDIKKKVKYIKVKKEMKTRWQCLFCSKYLPYFGNLEIHMRTHTREKPFFCKFCPKIFRDNRSLRLHSYMHRHKGKKPFPCTECPKGYAHKFDLKRHTLAVHSDGFIPPYSCSICKKTFIKKSDLKRHEESWNSLGQCTTKSVNIRNPAKCSICSVMFKNSYSLSLHMRVHKEILNLPHKCTFCSNSYTSREYLRIHQRIHTDNGAYTCTVCSKKLSNERSLKRHNARFHNNDQSKTSKSPFKCPNCPKTFFLNDHLKSHSRFHSTKKEFKCPICTVKYKYSQYLRVHMRSKH